MRPCITPLLTACFLLFLLLPGKAQDAVLTDGLQAMVGGSPIFQQGFTGFMLADPTSGEVIYEQFANKHFVPASNTKIFTFFASWQIMQGSFPALQYQSVGDTLYIRGTGYPLFLHPAFPQDPSIWSFLKNQPGVLCYVDNHFQETAYGANWSWDDYDYSYQPERSPFPIYGNVFTVRKNGKAYTTRPALFQDKLEAIPYTLPGDRPRITRDIHSNRLFIQPAAQSSSSYSREIPFLYSRDLIAQLLSDTLHRPVVHSAQPGGVLSNGWQTLYAQPGDTIYKLMMQESDNFLAEQLLLNCASKLGLPLSIENTVNYARKQVLSGSPSAFQWYDGSGLSRFNLFTPHNMVHVLSLMYKSIPEYQLLNILPAGGESGTIKSWYFSPTGAFVYAKTGTLKNVHCLSGYVATRQGKLLVFSFMHNHYLGSTDQYKREMAKVLRHVQETM